MCAFTSFVGFAAIGGYIYVGMMFGRVSFKAGNNPLLVAWDALVWPLMGWAAIEKLYKA